MYPMFDAFSLITRPSVYVISDSQLADYKQRQTEAEIEELNRLIEGHEDSIRRIKKTRDSLLKPKPVE